MRCLTRLLTAGLVALLLTVSVDAQTLVASPTLAFLNVTVIDATGAPPKPDQIVVVSDGRIEAVGDSGDVLVPAGAQSIDATGQFMIPGLWDLHVHTRYEGIDHLRLLLVNGVTTARDMAGPWNHLTQIKLWRNEIASGERLGPRVLAAGPLLDGPGSPWSHSAIVEDSEVGRRTVRRLLAEGVDFVKVYGGLSRESFFAVVDASRRAGLPFVGHVPRALSVGEVSDAGQRSIEHLDSILRASSELEDQLTTLLSEQPLRRARILVDSFSTAKLEELADRLQRNGTSVVPTLSLYRTRLGVARGEESIVDGERLLYIPASYRTSWEATRRGRLNDETILFDKYVELVGLLHRSGVQILAGTDVVKPFFVPGFSLHDELGLLVAAGLTEMEALQAATRDAARFVGLPEVGTIERDMVADLVLLDGNPIESIDHTRSVAAVVSAGQFFGRVELEAISSDIRNNAASWVGGPTGR